jgi:hypothetical protein
MRVDLHAKVLTRDGDSAGHVEHAVVDPNTNEVTDFVVSTGGLLGKDVLVPRTALDQASPEGDALRLGLDRHELERLPAYEPGDYSEFLNAHLVRSCHQHRLTFTRSPP